MDDEVQLISDGDGLAVIGPQNAAERFLKSAGPRQTSQESIYAASSLSSGGPDIAQAASEVAANSCYRIKSTGPSARLVEEHGL